MFGWSALAWASCEATVTVGGQTAWLRECPAFLPSPPAGQLQRLVGVNYTSRVARSVAEGPDPFAWIVPGAFLGATSPLAGGREGATDPGLLPGWLMTGLLGYLPPFPVEVSGVSLDALDLDAREGCVRGAATFRF